MSAKIFRTDRALRFGDCDISGTAYFPSYLDILNGVNEEFWAYLGYPWHVHLEGSLGHSDCSSVLRSNLFFGETLSFESAGWSILCYPAAPDQLRLRGQMVKLSGPCRE